MPSDSHRTLLRLFLFFSQVCRSNVKRALARTRTTGRSRKGDRLRRGNAAPRETEKKTKREGTKTTRGWKGRVARPCRVGRSCRVTLRRTSCTQTRTEKQQQALHFTLPNSNTKRLTHTFRLYSVHAFLRCCCASPVLPCCLSAFPFLLLQPRDSFPPSSPPLTPHVLYGVCVRVHEALFDCEPASSTRHDGGCRRREEVQH